MNISEKNIKFDLTNNGLITNLTINNDPYNLFVPIYVVLFKSHSFRNPVNDHLDDSSNIHVVGINPVRLTKIFGDIEVSSIINIKNNSINFEISTNTCNGLNIGLVIPVQSEKIFSGNDPVYRPMCFYKPSYKYQDQQEISTPTMHFQWGEKLVAITAESNSSINYFVHKQGEQNCVRVSSETNKISIEISFDYKKEESSETLEIDKIFTKIEDRLFEIEKEKNSDVTFLIDLCRSLRHAGFCWEIDYIKPNQKMTKTIELIKQVESTIYSSPNSVLLKNKFQADINQLAAFQTLRAHIRAENGQMPDAITILGQFFKHSYDLLNTIRKSTILFSLSVAYLCDAQFHMSYKLYEELWNLLRHTENNRRYSEGVMDAWVMLNLVYSFFMYHVVEFKNFFSMQVKIPASELFRHKQKYFINLLNKDITSIISVIGIGFYNHATNKLKMLPKYEDSSH